jgi:hypothetical protein
MPSGMIFDYQIILYLHGKKGSNKINSEGFIWIVEFETFMKYAITKYINIFVYLTTPSNVLNLNLIHDLEVDEEKVRE